MHNIPQMVPWFGTEEPSDMAAYMAEGSFLTEFKKTAAFEKALAEYIGVKHCIVVTSGTTALQMVILAAGIGAGDEVIVPNYTMIASPNSVVSSGAVPVFVDVEKNTLCMDIKAAEAAITPRTKAIMFVNANGRYPKCGIAAFEQLAAKHGLVLIEDACQALGARFPDGRHMGTVGLMGTLSFSVPKVITTGQGGAIITNDDAVAVRLRKLKDFGRSGGGNDVHDSIGYNYKFTDMQAVIGLAQMEKLAVRVERKKDIYRRYQRALAQVAGVTLFEQDLENTTPWFIDIGAERRDELAAHLKAQGIGSRGMYPPINKQKAYDVPGEHPVSNWVGTHGLWLPSAAQLTDEEIDAVTGAIADFYRG